MGAMDAELTRFRIMVLSTSLAPPRRNRKVGTTCCSSLPQTLRLGLHDRLCQRMEWFLKFYQRAA